MMVQEQAAAMIFVALDVDHPTQAIDLVRRLEPYGCGFKINRQLTDNLASMMLSPDIPRGEKIDTIDAANDLGVLLGRREFIDIKPHDIDATVAATLRTWHRIRARFLNADVSGVSWKALVAAVASKGESQLLGVTALTDMDKADTQFVFKRTPLTAVRVLSDRMRRAGFDGAICSPQELSVFRAPRFKGMPKMVPSIRPQWAVANGQARPTTPFEAVMLGADFEVIGRPLTAPPESYTYDDGRVIQIGTPERAIELIIQEIEEALVSR